jgi:RNA polymerase sigma factor for flagellar operon FliA
LTIAEEPRKKPAQPPDGRRREQLILESMPLVYAIAKRLAGSLPPGTSLDDLISAGTVGLIHAIDNFDLRFDVKLNTYAAHRIRGAMLDSIRSADWIPRRQRSNLKRLQAALESAQERHQRTQVTDLEVAAALGASVEEYRELLTSLAVTRIVSIEELENHDEAAERLADSEASLPSVIAERSEIHELLRKGIEHLEPDEQTVLGLYYEEGMAPQEIAQIMSLPAKRVYQIKAQAIIRLRNTLGRRLMRKESTNEQKRQAPSR